jgi:hypothetical protein
MEIAAKQLASGDSVKFPNLGWRRIKTIAGIGGVYVKLAFTDGKLRYFRTDETVEAELRTDEPVPLPGEIIRIDRETNRASVISPSLYGFHTEISDSFQTFGRVSGLPDSAARAEIIYKGATLFTEKAVYYAAR